MMSVTQNREDLPVNRRQFGGTTAAGVAACLANGMTPNSLQAANSSKRNNRAKSVVILYLYGAPSQMDTLDPKPRAPVEVRGDFQTISSSLPGVAVCEHLPNVAKMLNNTALIRSMTHTSNNHAVSVALSALRKSEPALEGDGNDPRHQPYIGSVLEYLWKQRGISMEATGIPVNMILPWPLNNKTGPGRWQHHPAWLGQGYSPMIPQFVGKGSNEIGSPSIKGSTPIITRFDPWDGVTPESTFRLDGANLPGGVSKNRFTDRRNLLNSLDGPSRPFGKSGKAFQQYRDLAFALVTNPTVARALDVTQEPSRLRDRYGRHLFGQSVLTARRLVEIGVKVTTIFWDTWTDNNAAWDTHHNHHPRLKKGLCPKLDQTLPTFFEDMRQRGLLDDTLVMVISEHGRTSTITNSPGGGREHWAGAYWGMFFGAGIQTGQVIGATDKQGGYPISRATHPNDILATMYHLLGFDPTQTTIPDRLNRPIHLTPEGQIVRELLS
jgi:hypothetical protein